MFTYIFTVYWRIECALSGIICLLWFWRGVMKNGGSSFAPWKISISRHFVKGTDDGGWCEKILRGICAVVWDWDAWGQKSHRDYCKRRILFGTNMFLPKQKPSIFSLDLHDKKTDTWIYSLKSCKSILSVSSAGWVRIQTFRKNQVEKTSVTQHQSWKIGENINT